MGFDGFQDEDLKVNNVDVCLFGWDKLTTTIKQTLENCSSFPAPSGLRPFFLIDLRDVLLHLHSAKLIAKSLRSFFTRFNWKLLRRTTLKGGTNT